MKKNIFTILIIIILFAICSISRASNVKIISSGNENNVFETTGTLRLEWKDEDDCDFIDGYLAKLLFIPDNLSDFGGKIAYVWSRDMSDAAQNLSSEHSDDKEDTLKLAEKIFKSSKLKSKKAGYQEIAVKIRLKSLKPALGCNANLLYSEFVNAEEIKTPKVKLSDEKFEEKLYANFTVTYTLKSPETSVNIMEKPDINSKVVKKLEKDNIVGEIQDFGEWAFVYYSEAYPDFWYGYVHKSELKKNIRNPYENIGIY